MAETYLEITQRIEALKQQAETLRDAEIAGVVERIKAAIAAYGLTVDQLFDTVPKPSPAARNAQQRAGVAAKRGTGPRFRDETGNSWSGRGPRPGWVKAALAAGKSLDDFAVDGTGGSTANGAHSRRGAGKPSAPPKYKDGAGHSWSGRGPRPGWVKAALEAGKTLDQLT